MAKKAPLSKPSMVDTVLENMWQVYPEVHAFGGERCLNEDEKPANGGKVLKPGSKLVVAKKRIQPFEASRQRIRRFCLNEGISFAGSYAFKKEIVDSQILPVIREEKQLWYTMSEDFVKNYPSYVEEWASDPDNAFWADSIRTSAPSVDEVKRSFSFLIHVTTTSPVPGLDEGYQFKVNSLGEQVFVEISQHIKSSIDNSKGRLGMGVIAAIRAMRRKAQRYEFLHPRLAGIVAAIDQSLRLLPEVGKLEEYHLIVLQGLTDLLLNPQKMMTETHVEIILPAEKPVIADLFAPSNPATVIAMPAAKPTPVRPALNTVPTRTVSDPPVTNPAARQQAMDAIGKQLAPGSSKVTPQSNAAVVQSRDIPVSAISNAGLEMELELNF